LVIKHIKPDKVILLGTPKTIKIRKNLVEMVGREISASGTPIHILDSQNVDAWNFLSIPDWLEYILPDEVQAGDELFCDVTGGTKAMSIGLMQVASKYDATVLYLDSEGIDNRLWRYQFSSDSSQQDKTIYQLGKAEELGALLTIQDLFDAHLGKDVSIKSGPHKDDRGARFEEAVLLGFQQFVNSWETSVCIAGQPDIDILLRKQNKFAIVECKSGKLEMKAVQQLNNLASDRYLGTYTAKILAIAVADRTDILETARQHEIHILNLTDWQEGQPWSERAKNEFKKVTEAAFNNLLEM
jgi:hypothetical protein